MHSSTILSFFGLVASASAHMKMSEPKGWFVNNSPLEASGSDFPCKAVDYSAPAEMNTYRQGQSAPLTFIGQAVHGGGSCQIVLTKDKAPTKSSVWKVIKSIEGGCPAQGEAGNMGDNAEAEDPYKYEFTIPLKMPAGEYTIAWTWFNKIGNREMYMNCGPATIEGEGGDDAFFDSLPDMFVANIGNGCTVPDSKDVEFPNPGDAVERLNGATDAFIAPTGSCGSSGSRGGSGGGAAAAPTPTKAPEADSGKGSGKGSDNDDGKLPGGVFVTAEDPAATPAADASTDAPADAPEATATSGAAETDNTQAPADDGASSPSGEPDEPAADPASATNSSSSSGGSNSSGGSSSAGGQTPGAACSTEGEWVCVGGTTFQRCASGAWSVQMSVSAGTTCSGSGDSFALSRRGQPFKAPRFAARMLV